MPNWSQNSIIITGDKETLELLKENNFSFPFIRPQPDWQNIPNEKSELPSQPDEHGFRHFPDGTHDDRWYNWRLDNWGTKWNLADASIGVDGDALVVDCLTAWSPPEELLRYATERFPSLSIEINFDEGGVGFYGQSRFDHGERVFEFNGEISDLYDFVGETDLSDLSPIERWFLEDYFAGGESWDYIFEDGDYDNEDRRWDNTNNRWDRINDGYAWNEDEDAWVSTIEKAKAA
jgi:hypothetical protein